MGLSWLTAPSALNYEAPGSYYLSAGSTEKVRFYFWLFAMSPSPLIVSGISHMPFCPNRLAFIELFRNQHQ